MFDSASAYFNTYYNASRSFTIAEKEALTTMETRPGGKNPLLPCQVQGGTKQKFTAVIEKCSKILQYHPNSSLVDDALMMIGKSYYYSDEDQSAERKFRELVATYPDGDYDTEARLYLSYSLYRMDRKDDAQKTAIGVVEAADRRGEDGVVAQACMLLGKINEELRDYPRARDFYQQAAVRGATAEQRVNAYLRVAEMYQRLEQFEAAEGSYRKAEAAANTYVGEYRGAMGAARMLARQKKYDDAIRTLTDLRGKSTYKEFFGEIELETANILRDGGNIDGAVERYRMIDTTYARTEFSARSYFALGEVYEKILNNYDSAAVAYTKGRAETSIPDLVQKLTRKSEGLIKYKRYRTEIDKMDSLKTAYLAAPRPDTAAVDTLKPDTTAAGVQGQKVAATADTAAGGGQAQKLVAAADSSRKGPRLPPGITIDSLASRITNTMNELAGLFYVTIGQSDSASYWYNRVLTASPSSAHSARALYTLAQIAGADTVAPDTVRADSLYRLIVRQYPESDFAAEARRILGLPPRVSRRDEAAAMYTRAEQLMLSGADSTAVDSLKQLVSSFAASPFAPRAMYAWSLLYEQKLSLPDSAMAGYQRLMATYPASSWAAVVRPRVTGALAMAKAAADTTAKPKQEAPPVDEDRRRPVQGERNDDRSKKTLPEEPTQAPVPKKDDILQPE
jgi:cellulose synthase operon protein C